MSVLNAKQFHDEAAAYRWVEAHVWPKGRVCPHCGVVGDSGKLGGSSTRIGVYKCYACRKPFTVKIGTIFESSHIKLHVWLQAIFLLCSSKKGISSNQLSRILGITLKSAWFLSHRIREAMADNVFPPMGGSGKIVEADETYFGNKAVKPTLRTKGTPFLRKKPHAKRAVVSLVERGGMKGVSQHCGEKHLHRYLAEFDFRYNARSGLGINDEERAVKALKGVIGKRLTYRTARSTANA
jgi:transposase-like protein